MVIGIFIGYKVSIKVTQTVIKSQEETIRIAIRKETTAINNTLTNNFKKIKSKKSEPINIVIDPTTNSVISNKDTSQVITVEKKKGFFKRLFTKKNKDE